MRSTNRVSFHNLIYYMSQSLDLLKNITSFYFWCKIQVLLYHKNYLLITGPPKKYYFFVLYFGQCMTICGPEFQRTSVIAYSCFCLSYKCFFIMRRTLLCWHHCFKFNGNDRLRNRDSGVGTCCWTLVTVKLCWFRYWYTMIIYVSLVLSNVVSFFYKDEGKRRFVSAFKTVIGLCYFSPLPWTQLKWVLSLCFLDDFQPQIVHL